MYYQGFTIGGQLVLPSFLKVKGQFKMRTTSQILCPPMLLFDLYIVNIDIKVHVAMIYAALQDFFPMGGFHLISIPFNIGTDDSVVGWPTVMSHRLKTLSLFYQQVIFVVTNHTDEDTGEMFLGADETGKGHAAEVDKFFDVLWAPFKDFLNSAIVYFASCSSLVSNKDSLTKLKASIEGFKVKHALAFDAPHLQATLMAELLAQLTKCTILHGLDFTKVLKDTLPDMSELGHHSSIIHFVNGKVIQYVWAHKTIQPWGQHISMQCNQCGVLQEWTGMHMEDGSYSYESCPNSSLWLLATTSTPVQFILPNPSVLIELSLVDDISAVSLPTSPIILSPTLEHYPPPGPSWINLSLLQTPLSSPYVLPVLSPFVPMALMPLPTPYWLPYHLPPSLLTSWNHPLTQLTPTLLSHMTSPVTHPMPLNGYSP
ncbi:hypothetical protein J3R83DRAFT_3373 [Lanmaoa asiatica]|nr:hypothetical protein J3R83DRAFT_3373 [Lanmaoa asiatica]